MSRGAGVTRARLMEVAEWMADKQGFEGVTIHGLAAAFGVKAPSLYNHVTGLPEIRDALRLRGVTLLTERLTAASDGDRGAAGRLMAMGRAVRAFAQEHPGLYTAALPTVSAPETEPALANAGERTLAILAGLIGEFGLVGEDALHATPAVRSAIHGFITLEAAGAFGMGIDVDQSFDWMLRMLATGLDGLSQ